MIDVLSVASEAYPLIKTGGLADVTGALPAALASHDVTMRTLLPGYPAVMGALEDGRVLEARFLTRGCTAAIAASSALTEWMTGKSLGELAALAPATIEAAVGGLEPASKHAAVLCVDAVRQLLRALPEK